MSNETRSPRFVQWLAFLVISIITLFSVVEVVNEKDHENGERDAACNWSIACSSITFTITLVVNLMHLNALSSTFIVGTKIEGGLCVLLVIFKVALVALVTDSSHGLAVDNVGSVYNGNLYYFSWAGFICSVLLLTAYLQDTFGINVAGQLRNRSPRLSLWSAHLATAIVVMGSAANFYDGSCGLGQRAICSRAVYGIVIGALATLSAVGLIGVKIITGRAPFLIETVISFILVILCGVGVGLITSQNGPGAELGNLYYFTWATFLTAFMLFASCVEDYKSASSSEGGDGVISQQNHESIPSNESEEP